MMGVGSRGFQSKNGVVTTLTVNGKDSKVIDTHVLSNHCHSCVKHKKKQTADEFERWFVGHKEDCQKNHEVCGGNGGTEIIFRSSLELYDLQFADISCALSDFGCTFERNFFGSHHGKGPSDGESAVINSGASRAVFWYSCHQQCPRAVRLLHVEQIEQSAERC